MLSPVFVANPAGLLSVDPADFRYFVDATGKAVLLSGAYLNHNLVDSGNKASWKFATYVDFLKQQNHNFTRLWSWEQVIWSGENTAMAPDDLLPYERSGGELARDGGPKYDLNRFNRDYFNQLRSRVIAAQQRGVYVSVVLFEGYKRQDGKTRVNSWLNHPFHRDNNVNRINGRNPDELQSLSTRSVTQLQKAYIRKVVDTLNDLDNVLYEVSGESALGALAWQHDMINYLKDYQATKNNRHPVGMSYTDALDEQGETLLDSPADWIMLEGHGNSFPRRLPQNRILVWNQDPRQLQGIAARQWAAPNLTVEFNLLHPEDAQATSQVAAGSSESASVIVASPSPRTISSFNSMPRMISVTAVETPAISPNGGNYSNSVSVGLQTTTTGASIYYTTDGTSPTESSKKYSGPFALATTTLVKAKAFKSGAIASSEVSAWFTKDDPPVDPASSSLVAHWKFDEGSGSRTADASGNGNTATLMNGPVWAAGKAGKALSFDGIDDNLTVTDSNSLDLSGSFTLAAWINPAATFTDFHSIIVKNYKYYLYASVAGYCGDGSPLGGFSEGANKTVCHSSPLPTNTWTHLALTYNGSILTLYRNGVPVANSNISGTASPTGGTLQIGASQFGEYFKGLIDEVRIYNRTLSAAEIQTIYQQDGGAPAQSVATPVISPSGGSYSGSITITMQTATPGSSIHYTTDGTIPTQSSTLYTGAITVTSSVQLKARAFKSGVNPSSVASASFTKNAPVTPASSLVAHWTFDEGRGQTASDASGNGNTAALVNGPVWAAGKVGKALSFDGIDDNLTVAGSNFLDLSSSFTLSAWVNPPSSFTDFRSIVVKNYKYYLYASAVGYCGDGSPLGGFSEAANNTVCEPSSLPINTWTHLAVTYNGSTLTLYRNGVAATSANVSETPSPTTGTLQIGASQFGEYFQGLIDEVRVYNKALGTTEIQAIYQQDGGTPQSVATPVSSPSGGNSSGPTLVNPQTPNPGALINFTLSNGGNKSVNVGSSVTNSISASLVSGSSPSVNFSVAGLPTGATASFSSADCSPNCSTVLNISTTGSVAEGSFPVTVTATGGGVSRTTAFTLTALLAASVPGSSAVAGNIFYVATNGSDSNSCAQARSVSTPKRTITGWNGGLACLVAANGDRLEIRQGTYAENISNNTLTVPAGSSWANATTIAAYSGETVTLTGSDGSGVINLYNSGQQYIVFERLVIGRNAGGLDQAIRIAGSAHHIRFLNVTAMNDSTDAFNVVMLFADNNEVIGGEYYGARHPGGAYAFYVTGNNNVIEGARIHRTSGYGIHNYNSNPTYPSRNTYKYNEIFNVCSQKPAFAGMLLGSGDGNVAYQNNIHDNPCHGIEIGYGATNSVVESNMIVGNQQTGIIATNQGGTVIKDNTIYANGGGQISTNFASRIPTFGNNRCGLAGPTCP